jgi:pimeloyl-ACP methyl ester carboxylesterase
MRLEDWKRAGKSFDFEGHRIFYVDEGAGEALVLIHGFPTASWDWYRLWPELTRRYRCIALDMLGFGFSAKPLRHDYSIVEQATLHERLLQTLAVKRAHVLSHDYGVSVALELLARYEERLQAGREGLQLRSLCLLNGGLFPEAHRPRLIQKLLAGPLGPLLSRIINERTFRKSFSAIFGPRTQPSAQELRDFWELVSSDHGTWISHRLLRYLAERTQRRERWVGALVNTQVPRRIVNGPLDPVSGAHMVARYRELVPQPDTVSLPGIGHYPQVEDPQGVLKAFFEFMAQAETALPAP